MSETKDTRDHATLLELATQARRIVESLAGEAGIMFSRFPRGACGPTCELLGRYLIESRGFDAQYVNARGDDGWTHAWLQVNGFYVDITADQFGQPPVIVSRESVWHARWRPEAPRRPICSPAQWPDYPGVMWAGLSSRLDAVEIARGNHG